MESIQERIKREYPAAVKMIPPDPERIKRMEAERFSTARAWIEVAQRLGRPLTTREEQSLNI